MREVPALTEGQAIPLGRMKRRLLSLSRLTPPPSSRASSTVRRLPVPYGLETVRLRFFNVFGPRQRADSPYSGVIAIFTAALTAGRTPSVFGDGLQSRDFVYVADVANALLRAAEVPGVSGRVYNVGRGGSITLLDLIASLNRLLGTTITANHGPERAGDIRHSRAKIDRIKADLGYSSSISFDEGLRRTLEWYRGMKG